MGRVSKGPRYFTSKRGWFAEINGVRQRLTTGPKSSTKDEAERQYEQLSSVMRLNLQGDTATVHAVLNAYLLNATTRMAPPPLAPSTLKMHTETIDDLCVFPIKPDHPLGLMRVRDLRFEHIQAWITARKTKGRMHKKTKARMKWSNNYAHMQLRILRTAFKWAKQEGNLISESPFSRRGSPVRIGSPSLTLKKPAITQEEHELILAQVRRRKRGNFALLLQLLYHTGARPAEVYLARGDEWSKECGAIVIDPTDNRSIGRLKNRRHLLRKGRNRLITIPDFLVSEIEAAVAKNGCSYLIRREDGTPWADVTSGKVADRLKSAINAVRKKGGKVREDLSFYSYRHGFVTRFLKAGGSPMVLCELLNTTMKMLQDHYSHLFDDQAGLLAAVNRLANQAPSVGNSSPPSSPVAAPVAPAAAEAPSSHPAG